MDQETTQNTTPEKTALPSHQAQTQRLSGTPELADQMAQATQSLADALHNLNGQFASLHAKIDRIIAAVDDGELQASAQSDPALRNEVAELEKTNHDLKAQAPPRAARRCRRW